MEPIEDHLLDLALDLLHFPQDDVTLPLNVPLREGRVEQHIREEVDGAWNILLEHLGVVDSLLARGVRVEVGAHVFNLHLKLNLAPLRRPLEGHVLEEVRHAVVRICLVTAPRVDPHANSGGLAAGGLGGDTHLVLEHRHLRRLLARSQRREEAAAAAPQQSL